MKGPFLRTVPSAVSTVGGVAGGLLPAHGLEEVSPRTTVIAEILAQTAPSDLQARKAELLAALQAQDPDLTLLVNTAIDLCNAMLQQQITAVDFSSTGSAESDDTSDAGSGADSSGSGVGSSGSDTGGTAGATGDGAELSPFINAPCEFVLDSKGDTALADLLLDGSVDRLDLQAIAANLKGDMGLTNVSTQQDATGSPRGEILEEAYVPEACQLVEPQPWQHA